MSTPVLGLTTSGTWGIFQSVNHNDSAEVAEARGADGKVIEQKAYSVTNEKQFEALIDSEVATLPGIGEALTVGTWEGIITSVSLTESNTEYQKLSVTAQKKDSATIVGFPVSGE
jgi:hypothetical protein